MSEQNDKIMVMSSIITLKDLLENLDDSALKAVAKIHPQIKNKKEAALGAIKHLEVHLEKHLKVKIPPFIPPVLRACTYTRQRLVYQPFLTPKY